MTTAKLTPGDAPAVPAVGIPFDRTVRPLALCAVCGGDKGYTLGEGSTFSWWAVFCGACGRQVDECRSDSGTNLNANKPQSWRAADAIWNAAGEHAAGLRSEIEHLQALLAQQKSRYEREIAIERAAEREWCIAALRALRDDSGVNDDGLAWLKRLTRGDCVAALMALGPNESS